MKQYKYVAVDETEIVFRLLSAEESDRFYQTAMNKNAYMDEHLFKIVTDNKYETDDLLAGIIPTVVYLSLKLSGVIKQKYDFPDKLDQARSALSDNAYYILYSAIIRAQPSYNLDMVKQKTLTELLELFAFSEMILGKEVIDVKKLRSIIEEELNAATKRPTKGIKGISHEEIEALKMAIGNEEGYGGMPLDGFSL